MKRIYCVVFALLTALSAGAQQAPAASTPEAASPAAAKPAPVPPRKVDRAAAYYHYTLAHLYEEQVAMYGRSELVSKAIDEYRLAIEADPTSEYLTSALAELYTRAGRIRDAVLEAQDILKRDPNNLEAHKLLGRIYLKSLGDVQGGNTSDSVLKLAIEQYEEIVKLQPDSVDDRLLLGRLYKVNNDLRKAEDEFKTAVKLQPDSEDAVTTLALFYTEEGDSTRAAEVLSSVPDAQRSAKLYSVLGYAYEQQKEYKKAIDAYRKAAELDRDNLDAIRGLAENLMNDGQTDAALEQYKIIAEANPDDAQTYLRMAEIYRRQGKFDLALENLTKAESMVQDSMEVPYNRAAVYQAQGRYDDAAQILQDLLKKTDKADNNYSQGEKSNRALFLERLGTIYRDNNNTALAIETFRKMLTLGDDNAERGYQQLIDTYREAKQWQQATDVAKEAIQKLPNDRDLKMAYAAQLSDTGQSDEALQQVKAMLKGTPDDRDVYIRLAQMNSRLKRWQDAEDNLNKAAQLSTKDEDKQYVEFLRGSNYERQKKYDPAETVFRKLLAADPQNAAVLNYLGYMLADRGVKLDEALIMIKKAVELDPANGAYLDSLGWAYFKLGKYDLAEDNLSRAAQHMGTDPTVQAHLGDLYQKTGRLKLAAAHWDRAIQEWNKTVAAEVDTDEMAKVQKDLESAKVKLAKEDSEHK
ncbi:MAG: tetratricopeptide repeat protein [Terriglobales bacterium]|jgi:tetratricopeptide (TPR) repeat protein